jgi:hypothetical protein
VHLTPAGSRIYGELVFEQLRPILALR